jgi:hypothetical protein
VILSGGSLLFFVLFADGVHPTTKQVCKRRDFMLHPSLSFFFGGIPRISILGQEETWLRMSIKSTTIHDPIILISQWLLYGRECREFDMRFLQG